MKKDAELKMELLFASILKWSLIILVIGFVFSVVLSDKKEKVEVKQASVNK